MRIGEKIKTLRDERDMTQQDLANILGKSRAAVGKYETGARLPDNQTLHMICDCFNVTTDFLLGRSEYKHVIPAPLEICLSEAHEATLYGKLLTRDEKDAFLTIINAINSNFCIKEK